MDDAGITIRLIEARDRDAFLPMLAEFLQHSGNPQEDGTDWELFFSRISAPGARLVYFGAFERDALLGIVSATLVESSYQAKPFAWCDDVFVVQPARGRGVATKIFRRVIRRKCSG